MTAIAVGTPDKLESVIMTLIAAAKAGELDGVLEGYKLSITEKIGRK